jgi:hypothetical protein
VFLNISLYSIVLESLRCLGKRDNPEVILVAVFVYMYILCFIAVTEIYLVQSVYPSNIVYNLYESFYLDS